MILYSAGFPQFVHTVSYTQALQRAADKSAKTPGETPLQEVSFLEVRQQKHRGTAEACVAKAAHALRRPERAPKISSLWVSRLCHADTHQILLLTHSHTNHCRAAASWGAVV